jgi:hypothetical protein
MNRAPFGYVAVLVPVTVGLSATPPVPTGKVTFNGKSKMATVALANGVVTFTTSRLPAGSFKITAIDSGDSNFAPSKSNAIIQVVNPWFQ